MCVYLKIKAIDLANESKQIRLEEYKRRNYLRTTDESILAKAKYRVEKLKQKYEELKPINEHDMRRSQQLLIAKVHAEERVAQLEKLVRRKPVNGPVYDQVSDEIIELYRHRVIDVAREARATNIARGFIKGLEYEQIEFSPKSKIEGFWNGRHGYCDPNVAPNWRSVYRMVKKYAPSKLNEFPAWMHRAGISFSIAGIENTRIENSRFIIEPASVELASA